ncbi:MAG: hypothetical protein R2788_12215 [Saprospiraceae bacterium]
MTPNTGLSGSEGTLQAIRHLGYVQIDGHFCCCPAPPCGSDEGADYQLDHLQELDREDQDYWAHAASYLPMEDYRFSLIRKKSTQRNGF